jgi:hypothetical protein
MSQPLSRRELVRQAAVVAAAVAVAPRLASTTAALCSPRIAAYGEPSKFLRRSPVLMGHYTEYRIPLYLLEPLAKAAWRLRKQFDQSPPHSYWCGNNFDYWTEMAGRELWRLHRLKETGTPETMAEYQRIAAVIGEDVISEFEWGISQPPVHY